MTLLFLALLSMPLQADSATMKWQGRLSIGSEMYAVTGASLASPDGSVHLSLEISAAGGLRVRLLSAILNAAGGEITLDGRVYAVTTPTAVAWRRQLQARLEPEVSSSEYTCRSSSKTERVCDSRGLVGVDESLSGKMRLIYTQGTLTSIRFFSLAEWANPFREYVSLSLEIQ